MLRRNQNLAIVFSVIALVLSGVTSVYVVVELAATKKYVVVELAATKKSVSEAIQGVYPVVEEFLNVNELRLSYGFGRLRFECPDAFIPAIKAEPELVISAFAACESDLRKVIPGHFKKLPADDLFAIFITIVGSRLAPYGAGTSVTYDEILSDRFLACGQHTRFVAETLRRYGAETANVTIYGFDSKSIGSHAMVDYENGDVKLILDPTTSIVMLESMNNVLRGVPANTYLMADFYDTTDEALEIFRRKVRGALRFGALRSQDIIYRYDKNGMEIPQSTPTN